MTKWLLYENRISVTLSKSTLVSEFKNDIELTLNKHCFWHFTDKSMLSEM